MARSRKPKTVEVGKCYRLYRFAGCQLQIREPGDVIVYVYAIEGTKRRCVRMRSVVGYELGYNAAGYGSFLRMVHSEAPTAKN